ncbi:putative toxin-antitoxin system toxin component, PIN family [Thermodesulfobacteriota bacterium]
MRVVVDTNVAVSGLLWSGPPNQILRWAREGFLTILACEETTSEFQRVIQHEKFTRRLEALEASPSEVYAYFMNLVYYVPSPEIIPKHILQDPFDNFFLAIALENRAGLIISGDKHLLDLNRYEDMQIVSPSEACRVIETLFGL